MCRAIAPPASRNRRSVRPAVGDEQSLKHAEGAKQVALHEKVASRRPRKAGPVNVKANILDDYVVFSKELGRGHYGCVRECVHRREKRTYACKSILKSRVKRLDHLKNEVELLSEVDHPKVLNMVDCYEDREYVHIVTERCTGGELFDEIIERTTDKGCFTEESAAVIVKSLLEAVAYLHERDIVHRDLKPENVLFTDEEMEDVRLIDLGLSRRHAEGDAPMTNPVGTAYYMAPELLCGRYDRSCDIWSMGTIVYILLCGYPPFNGDTDPDIFENIKKGEFHFPSKSWADKSDEAKDLIVRLMRTNPEERPTAEEALRHPWIRNLGRRPSRRPRRRRSIQSALRSLKVF